MTTKQYLGQLERLDMMIKNKKREIEQKLTEACDISVSYSERVQSSGNQDRIGSAVVKAVDSEKELCSLVKKMENKRTKIISQIEKIENNDYYQILLEKFVFRTKTFLEIADDLHFTKGHVIKLYNKALEEFEKLYGDEYLQK